MTIGAFSRATRLSPKALRLYEKLGLLRPAAVHGDTGYRYYHPAQVERARMIAWLRHLGMSLADIREVCELGPVEAATRVDRYWSDVLADTATRGQLASFLVDYLSKRGTDMVTKYKIRSAARSAIGLVRATNEDVAHAGDHLLAVADGVSGTAGGLASAAAVQTLESFLSSPAATDGHAERHDNVPAADAPSTHQQSGNPATSSAGGAHQSGNPDAPSGTDELTDRLRAAFADIDQAVRAVAASTADGEAVTTLTALLLAGPRIGIVHIGDSRAYRLRDGELAQLTHDHSYVQSLIDKGTLSPAELDNHPQRMLLARALTGAGDPEPDISLHSPAAGDRYLLCSDGLWAAVPVDAIHEALTGEDPASTAGALIDLAYTNGAPDNIACVVADVVAA